MLQITKKWLKQCLRQDRKAGVCSRFHNKNDSKQKTSWKNVLEKPSAIIALMKTKDPPGEYAPKKKYVLYIRGTKGLIEKGTYEYNMTKSAVESFLTNATVYRSNFDPCIVTSDMGTIDEFVKELALKSHKRLMIYRQDLKVELFDDLGKSKILNKKIEVADGNTLAAINRTIREDITKEDIVVIGCWIGITNKSVVEKPNSYIAPEHLHCLFNFQAK